MSAGRILNLVRQFLYNAWFYGFLAAVLWLDCFTDLTDYMERKRAVDLFSLLCSVFAALMNTALFLDLKLRRGQS